MLTLVDVHENRRVGVTDREVALERRANPEVDAFLRDAVLRWLTGRVQALRIYAREKTEVYRATAARRRFDRKSHRGENRKMVHRVSEVDITFSDVATAKLRDRDRAGRKVEPFVRLVTVDGVKLDLPARGAPSRPWEEREVPSAAAGAGG